MSKGGGKTQTQTSTQTVPAFVENAARDNLTDMSRYQAAGYRPYGGPTLAGFTPDQSLAMDLTRGFAQTAGQGAAPGLAAINGAAGYQPMMVPGAAPVVAERFGAAGTAERLASFMNPYTDEVVNRGVADLERTGLRQRNAIGDAAIRAGAFGGSRQGVAEGVAAGEVARAAGDLSATTRMAGFNTALGAAGQEAARVDAASGANASAANAVALANQGVAQQTALANQAADAQAAALRLSAGQAGVGAAGDVLQQQMAGAGALAGVGAQQQALTQAGYDQARAQYEEGRDFPLSIINLRNAALGDRSYGGTTTQMTPMSRGNPVAGALGGAATGYSLAGPWGAAAGGLLGLFGR